MFFAVLFLTVCTAQTYTMRVWTTSSSSTRVCSDAALNQVFTAGVCGSVTSGSTFSFVFTDLNATHVRVERFAGSSWFACLFLSSFFLLTGLRSTGVTADRNCDVPVNVCYGFLGDPASCQLFASAYTVTTGSLASLVGPSFMVLALLLVLLL